MVVDATIRASRVVCELDAWIEQLGVPSIVISDDGVEMRSPEIGRWAAERGVQWQYRPHTVPD